MYPFFQLSSGVPRMVLGPKDRIQDKIFPFCGACSEKGDKKIVLKKVIENNFR